MIDDPIDDAPDGLIGLDERLNWAARTVADSYIYFADEADQRSLSMFGTSYNFSTVKAAQDACVDARFRLMRALVAFAYAERAKIATKKFSDSIVGDA